MYQNLQRRPSNFAQQSPHVAAGYQASPAYAQPSPYTPYPANRPQPAVYNPNAPRPVEVFNLSDAANAAIPPDIRAQFHCDDKGRVLFFSSPPLDIIPPSQQKLSHSLKYMATKEARQKRVEERKRKRAEERREREEAVKRLRADEETALASRVEALAPKAVDAMVQQIVAGTDELYKWLYQDQADKVRAADGKIREHGILADRVAVEQITRIQAQSTHEGPADLQGSAQYQDEI